MHKLETIKAQKKLQLNKDTKFVKKGKFDYNIITNSFTKRSRQTKNLDPWKYGTLPVKYDTNIFQRS